MEEIGRIEIIESTAYGQTHEIEYTGKSISNGDRIVMYPAEYSESDIANSLTSDLHKTGEIDKEDFEVVIEDGKLFLEEIIEEEDVDDEKEESE